MHPELLVFDGQGHFNTDLSATRSALLARGIHKPQRIVVIVPAIAPVDPKVMLTQWNLLFPQNQRIARVLAAGQLVGDAYANAFAAVLHHAEYGQYEYILTLETDNMPPSDGVVKLLKQMEAHPELTAIAGLYFTKGELGYAMIMGDPSEYLNFRPQPPTPGALVECQGVPTGFTLWRMAAFREGEMPAQPSWFLPKNDTGGIVSPDLNFWKQARPWGHRCAVDCDVKVGHYDSESGRVW